MVDLQQLWCMLMGFSDSYSSDMFIRVTDRVSSSDAGCTLTFNLISSSDLMWRVIFFFFIPPPVQWSNNNSNNYGMLNMNTPPPTSYGREEWQWQTLTLRWFGCTSATAPRMSWGNSAGTALLWWLSRITRKRRLSFQQTGWWAAMLVEYSDFYIAASALSR